MLKSNDPYPHFWYEISCYLKTVIGLIFFILGCFLLLSPLLKKDLVILGFAVMLAPFGQTLLTWEEKLFGQHFVCFSLGVGILLIGLSIWIFGKIKIVKQFFEILKQK